MKKHCKDCGRKTEHQECIRGDGWFCLVCRQKLMDKEKKRKRRLVGLTIRQRLSRIEKQLDDLKKKFEDFG